MAFLQGGGLTGPLLPLQAVPFFGAVSISAFQPQMLSISSPYYRGPVINRIIPTGTLLVIALLLLVGFIIW